MAATDSQRSSEAEEKEDHRRFRAAASKPEGPAAPSILQCSAQELSRGGNIKFFKCIWVMCAVTTQLFRVKTTIINFKNCRKRTQ